MCGRARIGRLPWDARVLVLALILLWVGSGGPVGTLVHLEREKK